MGLYRKILNRFPRGSLSYVFAYGSGVKQQVGYEPIDDQKNIVIDLIFCIRDTLGWHAENIFRQPEDYSLLHKLGPSFIRDYQEKLGANVYFNTLVPLPDLGVTIKYGVVLREDLVRDLCDWKHLYLAGRLHKPVHDVVAAADDEALSSALSNNLLSALRTALLLLPEHFSAFQLFHTICDLSYRGDFRMIFGENKCKVHNIVKAQEEEFMELYRPAMTKLADYVAINRHAKEIGTNRSVVMFEQDKSYEAKDHHLRHLPAELCKRILRNTAFHGNYMSIVEHLARLENLEKVLQVSINDIVWRSSITQSLKNIPSAGLMKSLVYSYRKALKTFAN